MIDDGENAVISSALQQSCDQVHGDLGKGGHIVGYHDLVEWDTGLVGKVLVLLAHCTPFHILLNPCSSSRPTEPFKNLPYYFITAWVSGQSIVVCMHDLPL